jgi:hypothetical protein
MARTATTFEAGFHDYLYQVERVTKTLAGDVSYELTHFPVDSQGRSLVALAVSQAAGTGIVLTSNRTGISCDVNSSTDNTIPDEEFTFGDDFNFGTDLNFGSEFGAEGEGFGDDLQPTDGDGAAGSFLGPFEAGQTIDPADAFGDNQGGDEDPCTYNYTWTKKCGDDAVPIPTSVSSGGGFIISADEPNCIHWLTREKICPDQEPEITTKQLLVGEPLPYNKYKYFRFNGSYSVTKPQTSGEVVSKWYATGTYYPAIIYMSSCDAKIVPCGDHVPWSSSANYFVLPINGKNQCATNVSIGIYLYRVSTGLYSTTMFRVGASGCSNDSSAGYLGQVSGAYEFSDDRVNVADIWEGIPGGT